MADPHVISALTQKRRELAADISELEKQTAQKRADLAHINAALRIFDPKAIIYNIRSKQHSHRNRFFGNGELSRHCLDTLRESEGLAISADDIAIAAMKAKDMPLGDNPLRQRLLQSTLYALKQLRKRGSIEKLDEGVGAKWKISDGF